jgi:hypothetical protein
MKRTLVAALFALLLPTPAYAQECIEKACIEVYTQDGKIVIEGRKGSGPVQKKSVIPAPARTRKPVVPKNVAPLPKVTAPAKPKVTITPKKPVVKKPVRKKATTPATSLSDKLVEILPTAGIAYSPSFQPLIKVPVFFWCDIPPIVTKKIEIVGEVVEVSLKPTFLWHYGDGVIYLTRKAGGPYPDGEIQHTYSKPGHYLVQLITKWDGEFTVQGVTQKIPGKIESVSIVPITVVAAPTRFSEPIRLNR